MSLRVRSALAVLAMVVVVAAACSKEDRGIVDAPINPGLQDDSAPLIVNMPDQFMNLALKCVGSTLVVSHTREAAPVVIDDASLCEEGAPSFEELIRSDDGSG